MSNPNYQEAFDELQEIISDMEDGQITVDELTEKVARAATLIRICKAKLSSAEQNVQEILSAIDSQEIMDETPDTADNEEIEKESEDDEDDSEFVPEEDEDVEGNE